jgi:periplasmic protein CpxP/Spy
METRTKSKLRRALWVLVPVLAVGAFAVPRALAFGHHHAAPKSAPELAEHMEHGIDHLLDKVDATDEQREQANAIAERRAPQLFAVLDQGRQVRAQLKQVMLADTLDKTRLEQVRAQVDALTKQAADIGLDSAFELAQVLTPAQRKQVADRLSHFER